MIHALRLRKGQDLKLSLKEFALNNNITAGVILSAVGSVDCLKLRMAGATNILESEQDYEIVSVTGTIALDKLHLHMSFSDKEGKVVGGHLMDGTIINTTCELIIMEIDDLEFSREFDNDTGYNELVIRKK